MANKKVCGENCNAQGVDPRKLIIIPKHWEDFYIMPTFEGEPIPEGSADASPLEDWGRVPIKGKTPVTFSMTFADWEEREKERLKTQQ